MKRSIGAKHMVLLHPVLIIGTYDDRGYPNIMNVAWGGICCSDPPCIAISVRKATYTYANLMKHKAFTVNIPSAKYLREADYVGIYTGRDENKFKSLGLTPVRSDVVNAPYVDEFSMALECQVIHTLELGLHTQFIGKIIDAKADEQILSPQGFPRVDLMNPFVVASGVATYYALGQSIGRAFSLGRKTE